MSYKQDLTDLRGELRSLYKAIPEATAGFSALSKGVKDGGVMSMKEKEWIALGMAIAQRCSPCINLHVEAMMKYGGTREELGDILGMAIQMGGGPAMMYAAHALACWDELTAAQAA